MDDLITKLCSLRSQVMESSRPIILNKSVELKLSDFLGDVKEGRSSIFGLFMTVLFDDD